MAKHEPLEKHSPMSKKKRQWWVARWPGSVGDFPAVPRVSVLQRAAAITPRPSNPRESVALGYVASDKGLHDREPDALVAKLAVIDDTFWRGYPTSDSPKVAVGQAMKEFFGSGRPAHGKPNLRVAS